MRLSFTVLLVLAASAPLAAQEVRPKDVREIAKGGSASIPRLQEMLKNRSLEVRVEVVKQLTEIGGQYTVDPLIAATRDNDPEVQARATDGLVNFYLPGYIQQGFGSSIRRVGTSIKGKFTDTNDQVVDPYVNVRPDVVTAIGALVRGGGSLEVRANGARSVGILRGKAAVPDLLEAVHSKNTDLMYESLVALQKIRDESAGPRITFLLHDLEPKVQIAAIETTGLLRTREAMPELVDVLNRARDAKVKRAALTAAAMMASEAYRNLFAQYLNDRDDKLRAASAEGYARLKNPNDMAALDKAWQNENKTSPRLSLGFALVSLGRTEMTEFSPLQFLINNLNSSSYKGEAQPFLIELARDNRVRGALYRPLAMGTKDEKVGLLGVLAQSGDRSSLAEVQKLTTDADPEVAREALRAQRSLQARL